MWKKLSYHLEGISYQCCIHFLRNIDHFKINCNGENLKVLCSNITEKIHWAEDVKELIENETKLTYDIKVHTAGEIKAKIEGKFAKPGPLSKAMKIHVILITANGETRSKFLPSHDTEGWRLAMMYKPWLFLSPSGDLGISLVWHNLSPPDPTGPHFGPTVEILFKLN